VEVKYYWWFYAGAVPFAIGMLYFVADMGRSSLAADDAPAAAAGMAAIYFWMRWCQAGFCAGLWDTISPGQLPKRTGVERLRAVAALFLLQSLNLPFLLVGLFFAVPLGWIVAMLQNFTVLAATQDLGGRAGRQLFSSAVRHSHHHWAQNHGILLVLCFVALFTWINLIATCLIVPGLAKSFFGVESVFTVSPMAAMMNSTFFLGSILLTWLVVSPMMKAAYSLRCFYAESRHTGADLLSRLATCRAKRDRVEGSAEPASRRPSTTGVAVGLVLLCLAVETPGGAQEGGSRPAPDPVASAAGGEVTPEKFRESIGETMEQKKYQWQLSRRMREEESGERQNWLARRINDIADAARDSFRKFGDWLEKVIDKMRRDSGPRPTTRRGSEFKFFDEISSTLSIGLIVLVSALVAWLVIVLYRKYRGGDPVEVDDTVDVGVIDLQSEDIVASQLPEDEWMRLAREQMSKGDSRLAIRALFLATLAKLGEEGLLRIAKYKSNRDYRVELERRARKVEELQSAFQENTRLFERSWYGWHSVDEKTVDRFLGNHETIARESSKLANRYAAVAEAATGG
jgi:hypothetical protein